jgi:hypothetical protein
MKTTEKITKASPGATIEVRFGEPNSPLLPARHKKTLIQWATEQEVQEVSKHLASIKQVGIQYEADGDYFRSGDLAYQIQEIIRATAELVKKSQRAKAS